MTHIGRRRGSADTTSPVVTLDRAAIDFFHASEPQ